LSPLPARRGTAKCSAVFAGIGPPHGVATGGFQEWQGARNVARDSRIPDRREIGQNLVHRTLTQRDHSKQEMIAGIQAEQMAGAQHTFAIGPAEVGVFGGIAGRIARTSMSNSGISTPVMALNRRGISIKDFTATYRILSQLVSTSLILPNVVIGTNLQTLQL
jgi:hypothetical protein